MFLADQLSRAAQHETLKSEESFQVFSWRYPWPYACLKITPERLEQLQWSTGQNETLQTLKTSILTGWPMQKEEVPIKICEYWSYSDGLTVHNGVLFKGSRVVIPQLLRPEIKSLIHSSHLGVEGCLRKAGDTAFWRGMNADVRDIIKQCSIYNEFQAKNQTLSTQSRAPRSPMEWSCCRPIQASWQRLHSACGLLFRLSWSQETGREHI